MKTLFRVLMIAFLCSPALAQQVAKVSLAWDAPALSPFLTGTVVDDTGTDVNLTIDGAMDWIHFGDASLTRKATGGTQISNFAMIGPNPAQLYNDSGRSFSWTDGIPPITSSSNNHNGVWVSGASYGFRITAPADTNLRSVTVYTDYWNATVQMKASLSDGSTPVYMDSVPLGYGSRNYTFTYRAKNPGTLIIEWTMVSGLEQNALGLNAVTLRGGIPDFYNLYRVQVSPPVTNSPPPPPYQWVRVNTNPITALTYTDNTVVRGYGYTYIVRSSAMGTESGDSNQVNYTVPAAPTPPALGVPENLRVVEP